MGRKFWVRKEKSERSERERGRRQQGIIRDEGRG
jgi:hypothetical protein